MYSCSQIPFSKNDVSFRQESRIPHTILLFNHILTMYCCIIFAFVVHSIFGFDVGHHFFMPFKYGHVHARNLKLRNQKSDDLNNTQKIPPVVQQQDNVEFATATEKKKLLDMNARARMGRTKDQEGKSNIWPVETKMRVVEDEEGENPWKMNLLVGGVVIGGALASLPLLLAFSRYLESRH